MGVRVVNGKFYIMESVEVMVVTTKTQQLGAGTFWGGCFQATRNTGKRYYSYLLMSSTDKDMK